VRSKRVSGRTPNHQVQIPRSTARRGPAPAFARRSAPGCRRRRRGGILTSTLRVWPFGCWSSQHTGGAAIGLFQRDVERILQVTSPPAV